MMYMCVYTYIYIWIVQGFDSSRSLISRGGISRPAASLPEI